MVKESKMCQITIEIPDAVLFDIKMSKKEAATEIREMVALQYYVKHGVSLGYCADIAGMGKEDFIRYLSDNEISIYQFNDKEEFIEELKNA